MKRSTLGWPQRSKPVDDQKTQVDGQITRQPRGHNGFGWDPVFIPNGWQKTFAEMTPAESAAVSMRGLAVLKLRLFPADKEGAL